MGVDVGDQIPDVEVKVFNQPFADQKAAVAALKGYSVICMMRERTPFLKPTLEQLPDLKLLLTSATPRSTSNTPPSAASRYAAPRLPASRPPSSPSASCSSSRAGSATRMRA